MTGTMLTGVSTHICCAHTGADGRLHGHTWIITAWFPAGKCALTLKRQLEGVCATIDHSELLYELSTGEGVVALIANSFDDAVEVEASRPPEGIFALWRRAALPSHQGAGEHGK